MNTCTSTSLAYKKEVYTKVDVLVLCINYTAMFRQKLVSEHNVKSSYKYIPLFIKQWRQDIPSRHSIVKLAGQAAWFLVVHLKADTSIFQLWS